MASTGAQDTMEPSVTVKTLTVPTAVLSEHIFAVLSKNKHKLKVIIELKSMLELVNELMREEVLRQLGELKSDRHPRDRVEVGPMQQALIKAIGGGHAFGSVLAQARANAHIAVCRMLFAQEWPYVEPPVVDKPLGYVPPKKPSPEFLAPPPSLSAQEEMMHSLPYAVVEVIEGLKVMIDRKEEQIAIAKARKQQDLEASIASKQEESEMSSARGERLRRRNGDAATNATTSGAGGVVDNVAGHASDPAATPKLKIKIKPASNAGSSSSTSESGQAVRPSTSKLKIKIKPASNAGSLSSASKSVSLSPSSQGATKTMAVNAKKTPAASEDETMSSSAMRASYGQPSFKLKIKPFPTTGTPSSASKDNSPSVTSTNTTLVGHKAKKASTASRSKVQPSSASAPSAPASSSSSVASKAVSGTKRKASEELDKPKRKRTAASGPQQSWTAKEEMAVIPLWWKPDLDVYENKRKGHGTAVRVLKHAEWIKAQGGVWTRSWEALNQHVRTLREAGEDMASVKTRYDAEVRETGGQ
ncbi:hypothetical protein LTR56_018642 [Elasticomyces elasticus]|nr:hypothetical protein LTR56_018642 [Elasticomyces elasticus]KAK3635653.1 hypothetical protein LTR22_019080 [Elasticomyces elasticus]KAK4933097.1 hypothetical protein LTR49_000581 [Elasticomyces elasticus]KAK5763996.1 hypothetical protein LTS12_005906 [Elasticomyces elasticus]